MLAVLPAPAQPVDVDRRGLNDLGDERLAKSSRRCAALTTIRVVGLASSWELALRLPPQQTVGELRKAIAAAAGVDSRAFRLFVNPTCFPPRGLQLLNHDCATLLESGVEDGVTVSVMACMQ